MVPALLLGACTHAPAEPARSATADVDATFTDDAGTTGRYRLIAPGDVERPGVLLFFTPDFAGDGYAAHAERRAAIAAAHGLLAVAMANPDLPPGNGCWWTPSIAAYTRYVDQFVARVLVGRYHVDPDRVFLTGLSGGSDFAAEFPYQTGWRYRGGVVALCGGDVPRLDGGDCVDQKDPPAAPPPSDLDGAALDGVRYDFAIDPTDPLLAASRASAAFYRDAGFGRVTHRLVAGDGHCGFADGFDGLDELAAGLDLVDPATTE
jgi:poly(3-hydroxybutyrate) depolymerase